MAYTLTKYGITITISYISYTSNVLTTQISVSGTPIFNRNLHRILSVFQIQTDLEQLLYQSDKSSTLEPMHLESFRANAVNRIVTNFNYPTGTFMNNIQDTYYLALLYVISLDIITRRIHSKNVQVDIVAPTFTHIISRVSPTIIQIQAQQNADGLRFLDQLIHALNTLKYYYLIPYCLTFEQIKVI